MGFELCPVSAPQVQKSPVFRRDGADVHSDLHVSVAQAILGGTARTQGLYETLNLSVRPRLRRVAGTAEDVPEA